MAKIAFRFVLTIGIVNLFADFTYEGARSITGPFLGSLGASATVIGIVVGFKGTSRHGWRSTAFEGLGGTHIGRLMDSHFLLTQRAESSTR